jgi:hypothetical protein
MLDDAEKRLNALFDKLNNQEIGETLIGHLQKLANGMYGFGIVGIIPFHSCYFYDIILQDRGVCCRGEFDCQMISFLIIVMH